MLPSPALFTPPSRCMRQASATCESDQSVVAGNANPDRGSVMWPQENQPSICAQGGHNH